MLNPQTTCPGNWQTWQPLQGDHMISKARHNATKHSSFNENSNSCSQNGVVRKRCVLYAKMQAPDLQNVKSEGHAWNSEHLSMQAWRLTFSRCASNPAPFEHHERKKTHDFENNLAVAAYHGSHPTPYLSALGSSRNQNLCPEVEHLQDFLDKVSWEWEVRCPVYPAHSFVMLKDSPRHNKVAQLLGIRCRVVD